MGKIRLFFAASLDGYIADPGGGVGYLDAFHEDDAGDRYEQFYSTVETIVLGRGTYKFAEDLGNWPYQDNKRRIVLTHRPIERPLCRLETRAVDDIPAFARELRALEGDTWILGGGKVMGAFLAAGEVDSIEMSIVPVAIGAGIPMYAPGAPSSHAFDLLDLTRTKKGVVRSVYQRRKERYP